MAIALGCACQTPGRPEDVARAYARALDEDRLADAYALSAADGMDATGFSQLYADPQRRQARASAVRAAAERLRAGQGELSLVRTEAGWRVEDGTGPCRQALAAFVEASSAGDFSAAYGLLSEGLRTRYSPQTLGEDFRAEPTASARLERTRQALERPAQPRGSEVDFPVGDGRAVRMVREGGACRVATLE